MSFVTGRESNAEFDEQGNGNTGVARGEPTSRTASIPTSSQGDASSGLLPGVNPDIGGEKGDGDHRLQAYCYRMCLTDVPDNRVMIDKPEGYDEADYEILFRAIEAGQKGGFFKTSPMPNRKTDTNNTGGISTDYIGRNYGDDWNWATLGHEEREALGGEAPRLAARTGLDAAEPPAGAGEDPQGDTRSGGCRRTSSPTTATGPTTSTSARPGGCDRIS